ncbi:hypothetical protein [Marinomonas sp. CT5]|nr:hypothetical protein [Marinomonas sp. CT5]
MDEAIEEDYLYWEKIALECTEKIDDDYHDIFENINGFKFGG